MFACFRIEKVQTIRTGAKVDLAPLQKHCCLAISIAHYNPAWGRGDRILHQARRELDEVAVGDKGSGLL